MLTRSPALWAAIPRRYAMPSTPSTRGPWRPPSGLLASQRSPRRLRRERVGGFTPDAPPRPQEVRQTKQPVDLTDGRRGQLRGRHNIEAGQWREHPGETLARLGVRWERAKRWMESPDPQYARKKGLEIG